MGLIGIEDTTLFERSLWLWLCGRPHGSFEANKTIFVKKVHMW
jgi:hypothetical protein